MKSKTKLFMCGIPLAAALIGVSAALAVNVSHSNFIDLKATECTHATVEHYAATADHIEHWACCLCHHAWADEGRTIEISENTSTDRSKIETTAIFNTSYNNGDWTWDGSMTAIYDADENFKFKATYSSVVEGFIQTIATDQTIPDGKYVYVSLTNNTNVSLDLRTASREWAKYSDPIIVNVGQTVRVGITSEQYNYNGGGKALTGFALRVVPSSGSITGDVIVSIPSSPSDCAHVNLVHHEATATSIEFYSCGACKHAWADSARTELLSEDYTSDRTKIDTAATYNCSYKPSATDWVWDGDMYAVRHAVFGFAHEARFDSTSQAYIQTSSTSDVLDNYKSFTIEVTNNTNTSINAQVTDRNWGNGKDTITIAVGQTKVFQYDYTTWNAHDIKKGFAVRVVAADGSTPLTGNVVITKPVIEDKYFGAFEIADQTGDWTLLDQTLVYDQSLNRYVVEFDASNLQGTLRIYIRNRVELDSSIYSGVKIHIYHNSSAITEANLWNESWAEGTHSYVWLPKETWNEGTISINTWNGDPTNKPTESTSIGFYDMAFDSTVRIAVGEFVAA